MPIATGYFRKDDTAGSGTHRRRHGCAVECVLSRASRSVVSCFSCLLLLSTKNNCCELEEMGEGERGRRVSAVTPMDPSRGDGGRCGVCPCQASGLTSTICWRVFCARKDYYRAKGRLRQYRCDGRLTPMLTWQRQASAPGLRARTKNRKKNVSHDREFKRCSNWSRKLLNISSILPTETPQTRTTFAGPYKSYPCLRPPHWGSAWLASLGPNSGKRETLPSLRKPILYIKY